MWTCPAFRALTGAQCTAWACMSDATGTTTTTIFNLTLFICVTSFINDVTMIPVLKLEFTIKTKTREIISNQNVSILITKRRNLPHLYWGVVCLFPKITEALVYIFDARRLYLSLTPITHSLQHAFVLRL